MMYCCQYLVLMSQILKILKQNFKKSPPLKLVLVYYNMIFNRACKYWIVMLFKVIKFENSSNFFWFILQISAARKGSHIPNGQKGFGIQIYYLAKYSSQVYWLITFKSRLGISINYIFSGHLIFYPELQNHLQIIIIGI